MNGLDFGDYVKIEMVRFGDKGNEFYKHKVINRLSSNHFVDIPISHEEKETIHDDMHIVISVICCGIDETKVFKVREDQVEKVFK